MHLLITGVNGFIGTHYARIAKARGDTVIGLDLQDRDQTGACAHYLQLNLGAPEAFELLLTLPKVDAIIHGGGISGFMVQTDNPRGIVDVNIMGTTALLELTRAQESCRRIVVCSTIMVYGPGNIGSPDLEESVYPIPTSVYGASKVANESLMLAYGAQYGVDGVALRFSHVYGPGRKTECFVRDMLAAGANGSACRISQSADSPRQFVHIEDVCQSLDLALSTDHPKSRIYNISAGECHTLGEVARAAARVAGHFDVSFDASRRLPNYELARLSIRRAQQELGYAPQLTLEKGLLRDSGG